MYLRLIFIVSFLLLQCGNESFSQTLEEVLESAEYHYRFEDEYSLGDEKITSYFENNGYDQHTVEKVSLFLNQQQRYELSADCIEEFSRRNNGKHSFRLIFLLGSNYAKVDNYNKADSAYTVCINSYPTIYEGFMSRGDLRAQQEKDNFKGDALSDYNKVLSMLEEKVANEEELKDREIKDALTCHWYIVSYETFVGMDFESAKQHLTTILQLDPADLRAPEALEYVEEKLK